MLAGGTETHEHGADDGQQDRDEPERVRGRKRRHRLRHGHHRREGRRGVEGLARGPGCVRPRLAPEGHGGDRGRRIQRRDLAVRSRLAPCPDLGGNADRSCAKSLVDTDEGPRADTSARRPGQAAPGVPQGSGGSVTAGNSSQMSRRRRRGAAGLGAGDQGLRPDAARALRQLLGGRRAPGSDGHRPDRGDSEGAEAGRPEPGPDWTGSNSTKPSPRRRWR